MWYYWIWIPSTMFLICLLLLTKGRMESHVPWNYVIFFLMMCSVTCMLSWMLVFMDVIEEGIITAIQINIIPTGVMFATYTVVDYVPCIGKGNGEATRFSFGCEFICSAILIYGTYGWICYLYGFKDCYWYCMCGAVFFSIYVILDTWFILKGTKTIGYRVIN